AQPGGVDVSGPGEVDDELARATVEGVQHFLLHVLAVTDDQLPVHADHHDATLVLRQTEGHLRSPAGRTATTAVSTISSAVAPRDRSATGRASPWRMGPIASHPPSRCTSLYAMLPLSRSGNTSTLARPATGEPGALRAATSATSAASPCSSPSHTKPGPRACRMDTACRTRSTRSPVALPRVLYDRNATTGSSPTMRRRSRAAAAPASASWAGVGSGTTAQSVKVSTVSSRTM